VYDEIMSGLTDFSVDAQRRMFVEQQERERQIAEAKKATRRASRKVQVSNVVNDDDDYSVNDDDDDGNSIDSEESFYVGIERADYTQPDTTDMYGCDDGMNNRGGDEDRLGISRIEGWLGGGDGVIKKLSLHDETSGSSLHEFMNGVGGTRLDGQSPRRKNTIVAVPLTDANLGWSENGKLGDIDDDGVDQVYQHKAAEGKTFIETIIKGAPSSSMVSSIENTLPSIVDGHKGGTLPVLAPITMYTPGIVTGGVEDNDVRQMREREHRNEANARTDCIMKELRDALSTATSGDSTGMIDAKELMKKLEGMLEAQRNSSDARQEV
jgi:hypothetical protein